MGQGSIRAGHRTGGTSPGACIIDRTTGEARGRVDRVGDEAQMKLTDGELQNYDDRVLRVKQAKRDAYLAQVNNLIEEFKNEVAEDASFKIVKFLRAGSLPKGTVLREKVDADIAVFLAFSEEERFDAALLFDEIVRLLIAIY